MTFTSFTPRKLDVDEVNPMSTLLSRALKGYGEGIQLAAKPKQIEADLFAKQIGPFAQLLADPKFKALNPEAYNSVTQYLKSHLGQAYGAGNTSQGGLESDSNADYNPPEMLNGKDIFKGLKENAASVSGEGAQSKFLQSSIATFLKTHSAPQWMRDIVGDNNTASGRAKFKTFIEHAVRHLEQTQNLPHDAAVRIMEKQPGEDDNAYLNRLKGLFINEKKQNASGDNSNKMHFKSIDEKIKADEEGRGQEDTQEDLDAAEQGSDILVETPDGNTWTIPANQLKKLKEKYPDIKVLKNE